MALRDAGAEVIYLGLRRSTAEIWKAAVEDDVDVVGISVLSGAHLALARDLLEVREVVAPHVPLVIGGTIPAADVAPLLELGVAAVFPVGADLDQVVRGVLAAGAQKVGRR